MSTDILSSALPPAGSLPLAPVPSGINPVGMPGALLPVSAPPFSHLLGSAVANVQSLEDQASSAVQGLMSGQGADVHQAMIATQKSDMAFEMALAVRNKAVAAYQQVMQMQF